MDVITSNPTTRGQLSLLLRDLGQRPAFHSSLNELLLNSNADTDAPMLIDFNAVAPEEDLKTLKENCASSKWIGFQIFSESSKFPEWIDKRLFTTVIVLPTHAERAKARLKSALKAAYISDSNDGTARSQMTRAPFAYTRGSTLKSRTPFGSGKTNPGLPTPKARYIASESKSANAFIRHLHKDASNKQAILLTGNDGAEFELAAREFNFQDNADTIPLQVAFETDISIDHLQQIEKQAAKEKKPVNCYVGKVDDLDPEALSQLSLFCDYLGNLRNPHLRILLAYESGSDLFFQDGVADLFQSFRKRTYSVSIPPLKDRPEDIGPICQTAIGLLRGAHPFLIVRTITQGAIDHLVATRHELSYAKLLRILRNAMALSQRSALCVEDIKNYGDNELSNQHLLESMADENYFPQSDRSACM